MINTSKIGISRFFHEIFNFKKARDRDLAITLFNILGMACICLYCYNPSIKWSQWIVLLYLLSRPVYYALSAYFTSKKPSAVWLFMMLWPAFFSNYLINNPPSSKLQLVLSAIIVGGYYFSRDIYLASINDKRNIIWESSFLIFWAIPLILCFLKTEGNNDTANYVTSSSFSSNLISSQEVKESSAGDKIAEYFIKNSEKDSWKSVIPQTKGGGRDAHYNTHNYLRWLNSQTSKNFSNDSDLKIKIENLAQNITRLGETAFCINQLTDNNYWFLKANDKRFILESTLVWFKESQHFLKPIRSEPAFFIDGQEQVLSCSAAITRLLSYWSIEITKQKESDLYMTLVTIYGAEQAETILGQLILTNAVGDIQHQELKKQYKNQLNSSNENSR